MARGYIIGQVTVGDPQGYRVYAAAAGEAIARYRGRALVRGGRCEVLEGEGRTRNVILEFESYEAARAYYYSSEYQAARIHRIGIAIANVTVVEGT